jgi:putative transposase
MNISAAWFARRTEPPKPSAARLTTFICWSVCARRTRWRHIKQTSSHWIHETIGVKNFAWQPGHDAFTVSVSNCDAVKEYIANQVEHHRTKTFQEEYVVFLQKHGVEYDEKNLW